jgi:hypothetical protein
LRYYRARRSRVGVSELVGVVLTIAITLVAGAATWSFARSEAGVSEAALQSNVLNTNNYLSEQFKVIDMTFGSTTSVTIWIYNLGSLTFSPFQIRLYDSAGLINILYNYTQSGSVKTDRVFDLQAGSSYYHSTCGVSGSSYESPSLSTTTVKTTNAQTIALTIPSAIANCPSYGQTFSSGTTYTVVVTGLYGNVITYYQTK